MKIAAIICSVTMWLTSIFTTAVPLPYLPYVPPTDDRLWGYVFNMFGITAPDLQEVEDKAQVYWDTYRLALGAGYDAFARDMQEVFDKAKTSRKIEMTPALVSSAMLGASYALQNGVSAGAVLPPVQTKEEICARINALGVNIDLQYMPNDDYTNNRFIILKAGRAQVGYSVVLMLIAIPTSVGTVNLTEYQTGRWRVYRRENGQQYYDTYRYSYSMVQANNWDTVTSEPTKSNWTYNSYVQNVDWWYYTGDTYSGGNVQVQAQNEAVSEYISQDAVVPFTATSAVTAGVQALSVALPLIDVVPAEIVADLPAVQVALGVAVTTPLDEEELADIKAELEAEYTATYGDSQQFSVDLTSYFPFCIPFDLYKMLLALGAEPEAPSIDFPMITGLENGEIKTVNLHISLDFMDNLMQFVRTGELILSTLGLAMLTAKVIKW